MTQKDTEERKKKTNERKEEIERGKEQRIRMEHEAAT
jgi:hypothetical protein